MCYEILTKNIHKYSTYNYLKIKLLYIKWDKKIYFEYKINFLNVKKTQNNTHVTVSRKEYRFNLTTLARPNHKLNL